MLNLQEVVGENLSDDVRDCWSGGGRRAAHFLPRISNVDFVRCSGSWRNSLEYQRPKVDKATPLVRPVVLEESVNSASKRLVSSSHPVSEVVALAVQLSVLESHILRRACQISCIFGLDLELNAEHLMASLATASMESFPSTA